MDSDGFIKTFSIDGSHNVTQIDSLEHDVNQGRFNSMIMIDSIHTDTIPEYNETAAVKIIAAKGNNEKGVGSWSVSAFVRPYLHRLAAIGKKGVDLVTYPGPRQSYLADHKTLNYFYYYLASLYAKDKHGDEALILNSDSTVSETNTCSIMAVSSKTVILPESCHVLPGVTLDAALQVLSKSGYRIERKKIKPGDLFSSGNVILTNALMGAVPVLSLDGKKMQYSENICEKINSSIFNS